jgi:hypothetical protein
MFCHGCLPLARRIVVSTLVRISMVLLALAAVGGAFLLWRHQRPALPPVAPVAPGALPAASKSHHAGLVRA